MKELISFRKTFQRVGGWCEPIGEGRESRSGAGSRKFQYEIPVAPLPWHRTCLSPIEWPFFFGNQGGTAIISHLKHILLQGLSFYFNNFPQKERTGHEKNRLLGYDVGAKLQRSFL